MLFELFQVRKKFLSCNFWKVCLSALLGHVILVFTTLDDIIGDDTVVGEEHYLHREILSFLQCIVSKYNTVFEWTIFVHITAVSNVIYLTTQ